LILLVGCAEGHCRRAGENPPPAQPVGGTVEAKPGTDAQAKNSGEDRVFVYKYDGSLQCGQGKAVSVEAMAKQLKGIEIFSSNKKSDGLMHIQVCGSATGQANVFEIPAKSLKQAEAKGFKKWNFE
jgi:hypothetical protein